MRFIKAHFPMLPEKSVDRIYRSVREFFDGKDTGLFGGPITAGDAIFIAAMMEWRKPKSVIEIGVASGYSSAFIIFYARKMQIASGSIFLTSFDLMETHAGGNGTGQFLIINYPEFQANWALHTKATSVDILRNDRMLSTVDKSSALVFVDGGHSHPWPALDLLVMRKALGSNAWAVMQDVQMMERWIADCVKFGVPSPAPVRGVNLAFSLWPGEKSVGHDLCYNCSAVALDISTQEAQQFVQRLERYNLEAPDFDFSLLREAIEETLSVHL